MAKYRKEGCIICKKLITYDNKSGYCSICKKQIEDNAKIQKWLDTGDTSCGISTTLRNCIRDYIYQRQNNQCGICGINKIWNNMELKFVLDHIDGDASNNWENNLRLVCPNCDSQLDTYKSKNKNSVRDYRRIG